MASTQIDLAKVGDVKTYLENTPFAAESIDSLSGGTANFVYRVHLKTPFEGRSTVALKHAKPYLPNYPDFAFALERQRFEIEALNHVYATNPSDSLVTTPKVHHFDDKENVIIMDDCGAKSITLKKFVLDGRCTPELAEKIGDGLGRFLGGLHHTWGKKGVEKLLDTLKGHKQAKEISSWAVYGRIGSTLRVGEEPGSCVSQNPPEVEENDMKTLEEVSKATSAAIISAEHDFVMGDFWTGNILLDLAEDDSDVKHIFVVDWELAKPGLHGLDVGQFCAEVDTIRRFHPSYSAISSRILSSFYHSYSSLQEKEDIGLYRTAIVHWGAHLIVWTPRTGWGNTEQTRPVVKQGVEQFLKGIRALKDELESVFQ